MRKVESMKEELARERMAMKQKLDIVVLPQHSQTIAFRLQLVGE